MALYAFDGTWNEDKPGAEQDTNVVWFNNAYTGPNKRYWEGVGTRFGFIGRIFGGINGAGGLKRIGEALDQLKKNFAAGDTVVDVVGFSRGAALAVDFANKVGNQAAPAGGQPPTVRFLGVWDNVGSFDVPGNDLDVGFDLKTPPTARCIRHCMALDERRLFFPLTRLTGSRPNEAGRLMEVWFRGVHSDVGGGDMAQGLSSISLNFMFTQANMAGLPLDPAVVQQNAQRMNPDCPISLHPTSVLEQLQPFRTLTINDLVHFSVKPRENSQGRHHSNPPQELARVNDAGERVVVAPA
jgi:uncharacterized protein (DUF2235 family)